MYWAASSNYALEAGLQTQLVLFDLSSTSAYFSQSEFSNLIFRVQVWQKPQIFGVQADKNNASSINRYGLINKN